MEEKPSSLGGRRAGRGIYNSLCGRCERQAAFEVNMKGGEITVEYEGSATGNLIERTLGNFECPNILSV